MKISGDEIHCHIIHFYAATKYSGLDDYCRLGSRTKLGVGLKSKGKVEE